MIVSPSTIFMSDVMNAAEVLLEVRWLIHLDVLADLVRRPDPTRPWCVRVLDSTSRDDLTLVRNGSLSSSQYKQGKK